MADIRYFDTKGERNQVRAQIIWQILTGYVMYKQNMSGKGAGVITYGDLAEKMGYDRRAGHTLGKPVGLIHRLCQANGIPCLNAIVVREDTGIAGWFEMFPDENRHKLEQKKVIKYNWFNIRSPSAGAFKKYISI